MRNLQDAFEELKAAYRELQERGKHLDLLMAQEDQQIEVGGTLYQQASGARCVYDQDAAKDFQDLS